MAGGEEGGEEGGSVSSKLRLLVVGGGRVGRGEGREGSLVGSSREKEAVFSMDVITYGK